MVVRKYNSKQSLCNDDLSLKTFDIHLTIRLYIILALISRTGTQGYLKRGLDIYRALFYCVSV
jgi:hypothetical protein